MPRTLLPWLPVWLLCALLLVRDHDERWYPHDEGTLGQSAERVLAGELPHRDFDAVYTGGLSYLHAGAFRLLGTHLHAMRIALLVAALVVFLPALSLLAARVAPPAAAAGATLVGVAWSLPNYFAGMPSWYLLFLALAGALALLRYTDTRRRRWLVVAGITGGMAALLKVSGLAFLGTGLLFLAFDEQEQARARPPTGSRRPWAGVTTVAAALLIAALLTLMGDLLTAARLLHFVLPGAALALLLVRREAELPPAPLRARAGAFLRRTLPFLLGVLLPLVPLVLVYAAAGALGDLVRGLLVLPVRRLEHAALAPPPLAETLWAVPLLAFCLWPRLLRGRTGVALVTVLAVLTLVAVIGGARLEVYRAVWASARPLGALAVLVAAWVLARGGAGDGRALFLLAATTAFHGLVQFPFSSPVYFCYVAPLVALLVAALLTRSRRAPWVPATAGALYLGFALLWLHGGSTEDLGWGYHPRGHVVPLGVERGGVRVHASHARETRGLLEHLARAPDDRPILAAPDCPEVYFLSGRENPTRSLFAFLGRPEEWPPPRELGAVVVNTHPRFSPPLPRSTVAAWRGAFPRWTRIGRFEVGTRE